MCKKVNLRFKKPKLIVAGLAALALSLAACGGGASSETKAKVEVEATDAEIEQVAVAFPGSLSNLYIGQESGILNYNLAATVQEGLVAQDANGELVPALAESWDTPDDVTYVFKLRKHAKFHNGHSVTPEDIIFSIEKAADPEVSPGVASYLSNLKSAKKTADNEVTVKSKKPDATFLGNLSNAGALVVTEQTYWENNDGKVGTNESLLMGTGPYEVTEFNPGSHVVLERADTWQGDTPKAKTVRVNFIPDANTRLAAAQKGDVDIAFNVPINQVNDWQALNNMRIESMSDLSYVGLLFDQEVKPFDDPEVREAIASSINKDAIAEKLLRGYGEKATAIMTPESLADSYSAEEARNKLSGLPQTKYDAKHAKELISTKTIPSIELTYPNTGPQLGIAAQAIADNLKDIGVTVNLKEVPIEEWLATIGDKKHGVGFMWYFSTTGDPGEINSYLLGPDNPNHYTQSDAEKLISESNALIDPIERSGKLLELETLNAEKNINEPLWWGKSVTAFSNEVGISDYSPYTFTTAWAANIFAAEVK